MSLNVIIFSVHSTDSFTYFSPFQCRGSNIQDLNVMQVLGIPCSIAGFWVFHSDEDWGCVLLRCEPRRHNSEYHVCLLFNQLLQVTNL